MQTPAVIYFHLIDNAFLYGGGTIRQANVRHSRRQCFILDDVHILSHRETFEDIKKCTKLRKVSLNGS